MLNNFQHPYGKVNNAAIDFITFTTKLNNPKNDRLVEWFKLLQEEELQQGSDIKAIAPQGYHGWQTDHYFYGVQKHGYWFIVSSSPADKVARELLLMDVAVNITRLDPQVTILTDEPWTDFASFMRHIVRANEDMEKKKLRVNIQLHETNGDGDTCYIGGKKSKRRLTIYDKTAEQKRKIPGNQYRFEVRLRGTQAAEVWPMFGKAADTRYVCMSLVSGRLLNAGLPVPWDENTEPVGLPSTYRRTTQQKTAEWICTQVAPAFQRVTDERLREQVRLAMGF